MLAAGLGFPTLRRLLLVFYTRASFPSLLPSRRDSRRLRPPRTQPPPPVGVAKHASPSFPSPTPTVSQFVPRHGAAAAVPPPRLPGRVVAVTPVRRRRRRPCLVLGRPDRSIDRSMGVHLLKKQHSSASLGGSSGGGSMPPKGCMAVRVVGPGGGEEEERFVVPVGYLKHPLFVALLKAAEEEYGFEQKGAITIPCGVDHFRRVQGIIHHKNKNHHHHNISAAAGGHHSNHFHIAGCFRA
ncbi:hypothetical protein HU200_043306 [Digitaria exilis]|uniref:Small auxin up regulated protein n=1 Tax=Digitaria exilis TaxID=1010633 RepID=A0A835BER5_9POAL|nr:hypothetical protein HU200_043306 [Digitaria exilis]